MKPWWLLSLACAFGCQETKKPEAPPPPAPAVAASQPASKPSSQPEDLPIYRGKKQAVSIGYIEPCAPEDKCLCRGVITHGQNALAKVGVTEAMLAKGTPCAIGDFDENGVNDFMFYPVEGEVAPSVLMFDARGLQAALRLPQPVEQVVVRREGNRDLMFIKDSDRLFLWRDDAFSMGLRPTTSR